MGNFALRLTFCVMIEFNSCACINFELMILIYIDAFGTFHWYKKNAGNYKVMQLCMLMKFQTLKLTLQKNRNCLMFVTNSFRISECCTFKYILRKTRFFQLYLSMAVDEVFKFSLALVTDSFNHLPKVTFSK